MHANEWTLSAVLTFQCHVITGQIFQRRPTATDIDRCHLQTIPPVPHPLLFRHQPPNSSHSSIPTLSSQQRRSAAPERACVLGLMLCIRTYDDDDRPHPHTWKGLRNNINCLMETKLILKLRFFGISGWVGVTYCPWLIKFAARDSWNNFGWHSAIMPLFIPYELVLGAMASVHVCCVRRWMERADEHEMCGGFSGVCCWSGCLVMKPTCAGFCVVCKLALLYRFIFWRIQPLS